MVVHENGKPNWSNPITIRKGKQKKAEVDSALLKYESFKVFSKNCLQKNKKKIVKKYICCLKINEKNLHTDTQHYLLEWNQNEGIE